MDNTITKNRGPVRRYTASELKLAGHLFDLVIKGTKTSTIRYGFVFVSNECLRLCSSGKAVTVRILAVDYSKTLGSLTEADAQQDGFATLVQLQSEMKRFYPEIVEGDPVTIFRFAKVES